MMQYCYTERLALTSFLNSLLNEWQDHDKNEQEIVIHSLNGDLVLPLLHDSLVQRFSFAWPAKIRYQGKEKAISYQDVVSFICAHENITTQYTSEQINHFKTQVLASQAHMEAVMSTRSKAISIDGFIAAEQSLIGGHNLHPASKAYQGWSPEQARMFSPDNAGEFALHWYFVKSELLAGESATTENGNVITSLTILLMQSYQDAGIDKVVPDGFVPYPVHPYQAQILNNNRSMQQYFTDGLIVPLKAQGRAWRATSSTRTLWQQDSRWMLKFSLAVKLTNSIRHLSRTELSRGVLFQQVSNEIAGAEFNQRFPHFNVLQEPAWCGLQDVDGELLVDSLFCWRENPYLTGKEPTVTLATMTQENADGGNPIAQLVSKLAQRRDISIYVASTIWFEHFLENIIKPVAVARGDYGLVLLAHQQNLLVTLNDFLPVGGAFRDCQGTGYTDTALSRFPLLKANTPAYFVASDTVNSYFSYYLIVNSLHSVIAALSIQLSSSESAGLLNMSQHLWRQLAQHRFHNCSFYRYLLSAEKLTIKGNFFCFLAINNETALKDPSQIYVDIKNPYRLLNADPSLFTYKPILFNRHDKKENQTALHLIFSQFKQCVTVQSNWQKWHLQWFIDEQGSYCLAPQGETYQRKKNLDSILATETKMSPKQWFNVIELFFCDLLVEAEKSKQRVVQKVKITEQTWQVLTHASIPHWLEVDAGFITIKRSVFFQFAGIWNVHQSASLNITTIEAENGNHHPLRPKQPEGIWFQRYIYPLQRVLSLRCVDVEQDVAIFNDWHNTPNISRMWELTGSLDNHRDYLHKQTNDAHSMAVIGYFDGVPFGYFEVYWTPEDRLGLYYDSKPYDRGVHMLVGHRLFLGHKNFINWSSAVVHALFIDESATSQILGEPRADNHHVIRITKKIGMDKIKEFDFPHKRAALMCAQRDHFFNSII